MKQACRTYLDADGEKGRKHGFVEGVVVARIRRQSAQDGPSPPGGSQRGRRRRGGSGGGAAGLLVEEGHGAVVFEAVGWGQVSGVADDDEENGATQNNVHAKEECLVGGRQSEGDSSRNVVGHSVARTGKLER